MELAAPRVVWVVDDSRLDVERARRVLARDYDVQTFDDGSAALEAVAAGANPDVIVLDWVMPGVSGVDVCRFLRATGPHTQKIGVLLLTVQRDTEQIVEGLSAGANDFLAKPFEDEELRARVASLLRTRDLVDGLERAQHENRKLLESAPDPFLVVDSSGQLTFANELALEILGTRSVLGLPIDELLPDLHLGHVELGPRETIVPLSDLELGAKRFSPTLRKTVEGNIVVALRDVTERRMLDERRLDFYSMIAHDLRTPLNAMTLRLYTMREAQRQGVSTNLERDLEKLDSRLHSLVELINDFLDLARLEGAAYRLARDEVDLHELMERVREDFAPLIERGQLDFVITPGEPRVSPPGDANRLLQVLTNLFGNAIKFTPAQGRIEVETSADERYVEVSVRDTGHGIEPAKQGKLFQRYSRAGHSEGGTGLGLLIVREIVEAHGGTVGVESRPGEGSRFWFRLPRVAGVQLRTDFAKP
ncbi:MAG TPA: ATP-binding protein [Polyangiales bacterium]|nr:ATP-binding protein [Polyangiales bacterium]